MRVLFVNHTSARSGAEISLADLVTSLPAEVTALVACPDGEIAEDLRGRGIEVQPIPAIDASFRLDPVHTPRGVAQTLRSAITVRRVARQHGTDIIHANSIRAGLAALIASAIGGPPVVVHVRDCLPESRMARVIQGLIARGAAAVVANSRYTAESFGADRRGEVTVVHSPIDLERFDPARTSELSLGPSPVLTVVAQITPWKGQDTAIEALALLRQRGVDARLMIVGDTRFTSDATRYDNAAYLSHLRLLVSERRLQADVTFTGQRPDVPAVLAATDILLVPSWEEPFGRAVVEAMAMGTPVIATKVGGPAEVIEDGVNGRLVEPRLPDAWARAIEKLIADPDLRQRMSEAGRRTALSFDRHRHAEQVVAAYRRIVSAR